MKATILSVLLLALVASVAMASEVAPIVTSPATTIVMESAPAVISTVVTGITARTGQYTPGVPQPADMRETREFNPAKVMINRSKLNLLAGRLFAEDWVQSCTPVWGPLPWPSRVTQTYGQCPEGESLLPIDAAHGQWRPGWTWWKDDVSGVHLEKCLAGNWILTTFVLQPEPEVRVQTVTKIETRVEVKVIEVPRPFPQPVLVSVPARQFIAPAGVSAVWTPALPVPTGWGGSSSEVKVWGSLVAIPKTEPQKPESQYCPPGTSPPPPSPPPFGGSSASAGKSVK